MKFTMQHTFDAPIDRVWAMFSDPDAHVTKFTAMGHRDIDVLESEMSDDSIHLVVTRVVEMDLPGFAKRVMKPTNTVVTTDDWHRNADGTCEGTQDIDTKGAPVKVNASTKLVGAAQRTEYTVEIDLSVKVPLIGGKLSDWSRGMVSKQVEQEFNAGDSWLSTHK